MTDPTLTCPSCKTEIKLTESLAAPIVESARKEYEKKLAQKETEFSKRESAIKTEQEAVAKAKEEIDQQVAEKVKKERAIIATEEAKKAKLLLGADLETKAKELSELHEVLKQRDEKLAEAQQAQAELIRKQRELDDAKREMELTIEKRVQGSLATTRDQAKKEAEDQIGLRVAEKEQTIQSMTKQIEELKRRAEQGSQQLQGEVLELKLEGLLRSKFPTDLIEPVQKGEFGGDAIQRVVGPLGKQCGAILWESKRTKTWTDNWLTKLRDDQRAAKAELAIIVSVALPKGTETFDQIDGIWVTNPQSAIPLAIALRHSLIELSAARNASEGQQTKMELVYQYLTGTQFRQRVQAIVEKFSDMQTDLDKERKSITKSWAKREQQIRGVIESTAGMYGDLQGIAGKSLQEIEGLEMKMLEAAPESK